MTEAVTWVSFTADSAYRRTAASSARQKRAAPSSPEYGPRREPGALVFRTLEAQYAALRFAYALSKGRRAIPSERSISLFSQTSGLDKLTRSLGIVSVTLCRVGAALKRRAS